MTLMQKRQWMVPWSVEYSDYTVQNGLCVPTRLKATWHYPDGNLLYFCGKGIQITYYSW